MKSAFGSVLLWNILESLAQLEVSVRLDRLAKLGLTVRLQGLEGCAEHVESEPLRTDKQRVHVDTVSTGMERACVVTQGCRKYDEHMSFLHLLLLTQGPLSNTNITRLSMQGPTEQPQSVCIPRATRIQPPEDGTACPCSK